jgi:hypothetical protein
MSALAKNSKPAWEATVKWERHSFERVLPKKRRQIALADAEAEEIERIRAAHDDGGEEVRERLTILVCLICFSRPGIEPIRFRVNPLKNGRFTFSDPRGLNSGTAGTTGIWGTRPALRASRPRSLTPTDFIAQAARFIGIERAEQIVQQVMNHEFFSR